MIIGLLFELFLPAVLAAVVVAALHPRLVKIAIMKNIVDNPNARKLNKEPIPVLGGAGIFMGVMIASVVSGVPAGGQLPVAVFAATGIMLYTGVMDDIFSIRPSVKLVLQVAAVAVMAFAGGLMIDDFQGLWGVYELSPWVAWPLTLLALAGLINGINLIDGVDGLLALFVIVVASLCGVLFMRGGDAAFTVLSFAMAGAMIPFFMHNVFGRKYKMFLGDGGSLVIGILLAAMVARLAGLGAEVRVKGVVAFIFAAFSLPIFDTLRVMVTRIAQGRPPFSPDQIHMHHLFIRLEYSHLVTTGILMLIDLVPLAVWLVLENVASVSLDAQFYIVIAVCMVMDFGLYWAVGLWERRCPEAYEKVRLRNARRNERLAGALVRLRRVVDGK